MTIWLSTWEVSIQLLQHSISKVGMLIPNGVISMGRKEAAQRMTKHLLEKVRFEKGSSCTQCNQREVGR